MILEIEKKEEEEEKKKDEREVWEEIVDKRLKQSLKSKRLNALQKVAKILNEKSIPFLKQGCIHNSIRRVWVGRGIDAR